MKMWVPLLSAIRGWNTRARKSYPSNQLFFCRKLRWQTARFSRGEDGYSSIVTNASAQFSIQNSIDNNIIRLLFPHWPSTKTFFKKLLALILRVFSTYNLLFYISRSLCKQTLLIIKTQTGHLNSPYLLRRLCLRLLPTFAQTWS